MSGWIFREKIHKLNEPAHCYMGGGGGGGTGVGGNRSLSFGDVGVAGPRSGVSVVDEAMERVDWSTLDVVGSASCVLVELVAAN